MRSNRPPARSLPSREAGPSKLVGEAIQLYRGGNPDAAQALLQDHLDSHPNDAQALLAFGIIAAETGRLDDAEARLLRVLELDPKFVPALCWMSFVSLRKDLPVEAAAYAQAAIQLSPGNPAAYTALGRSLARQGLAAQAVPIFQQLAKVDPNNALALYDLADALSVCGRERETLEILRQAVLLAPEPMAILKLASLEMRYGRIEDAERLARRALRKDPALASAHTLLARILTEQSRMEEADTHWQKANEIAPNSTGIILEKAMSLTAAGEFEGAIQELRRAIQANPTQGMAYQSFAYTKRVTSEDLPLVRQMETVLSEESLTDEDRVGVLYALGKSYDNLGEYEKAIGCFDQANELRWKLLGSPPMDRQRLAADVDAKIKLFSKDVLAEAGKVGIGSALPFNIVGMMRSGTTFLEQMLSCHPKIGGAGEQIFWGNHDAEIVDYRRLAIDRGKLRTVASQYVQLLASIAPGFPHVIDKNPANLLAVGSLRLAFPNGRIIHTRRSPVDTALSIWMTPMSTTAEFFGNKANIVFAYQQFMRLMDHWREVLPADRYMEVQYEDLVSDPETHGRKIVEFCGLEWDEACLHAELNKRRVITPSLWQVRQPIYKTSTQRWKKYEPWLGEFAELLDLA